MTFTATQIAVLINGEIEGSPDKTVAGFGRIEVAQDGQLAFLANPKYEDYLYTTKASVVIISDKLELKQPLQATLIRVTDPYSAFASLLHHYQQMKTQQMHGVQEPSFISPGVITGENVFVGAFAYIGEASDISNNVKIFPGVFIGNNVKIGENTILHPGLKFTMIVLSETMLLFTPELLSGGMGLALPRNKTEVLKKCLRSAT
jgi:UDP-3-O-[3-hydroxymyristoyl] glucosamine N-acyltransferase